MKQITINTLIFGLLLSTSFMSNAQDDKYIVLDKKAMKGISKESKTPLQVENDYAVKFDPTRMLVGEIGFSYELVKGLNSSVEFELGPTLSNLYDYNHYYNFNMTYHKQSALGVFGSMGFRYYPMHGALNGFYVSPKLKYRAMNTQYIDQSGTLENERGVKNQYSFMFNMGYQTWLSKTFSLDFYGGMGIGYNYTTEIVFDTYYDDVTMQYVSNWSKQKYQGANLVFNFGVKAGIGAISKK